MFDLREYKKNISRLCQKYEVSRFEVFGSVLSEEFNAGSDIDCLIDFIEDGGNYFERYFDFKAELEKLFGRKVDLVVEKAIRNPYFKQNVNETKQVIYAA